MLNPERIFGTMTAYQQSQALLAAINLDLFTLIDNGAQTATSLAQDSGASEKGIRILSDYLVVMDFLKKENGKYSLTEESKFFLSKNSPAYLGSASLFLNSEMIMGCFDNLEAAVKKGGTAFEQGTVDPENSIWVDFARGMAPMMRPASVAIAKSIGRPKEAPLKVLDIAAGHGVFGIEVAKEYPNATITALDWKNVLTVAVENATKAGIKDRYKLLPGSAFDLPLEDDFDVLLITNFLHHFDIPTCEKFLKKMHSALKVGGKAITLEFVPNEDRVSPPMEAAFSLVMLASTPSGDAYTASEYQRMFKASGFSSTEVLALDVAPQHLIISEK